MFRINFILALCLLWPLYAVSQFEVSGRVYDKESGTTLPGAHVVVEGTTHGVFTNRDGAFSLGKLAEGEYVLRISFLGYRETKKSIVLLRDLKLDIYLDRHMTITEEVVVTALRAAGQAPVTFTNVDAAYLTPKNLGQDLPALLSQTPSLVYSSDAGTGVGYTWMNIRGSDQSRINITLNGIPLNDAESHGVWWVNLPDIVSSIDNLQIQRGVGLSTHGAGAFGASINLMSTSLRDQTYAELNSSAGSFNTLKNTVSFGTGMMANTWSFDGRLSRITSDGFIDRASADLKSFYLSGGYYSSNSMIKAVVFSGQESTYQAWYGVPSDSLATNRTFNPAGLYVDDDGKIAFYDNETDNYQQDHYQLHLSHSFSQNLMATAALHYTYGRGYYEQFRHNERLSRYGLPPAEIGGVEFNRSDLIRRRWLDNHFYGLTYSLNYNNLEGYSLIFGGAYNEYHGDHFGEIIWARHMPHTDIRHRYYDNNARKNDFNTFVKTSYELFPGLHLLADVQYRYVYYNFLGLAWVLEEVVPLQQSAHFHFFNPKAGITYNIDPASTVYVYAGIGNREPVRRDFTESSPESRPRHETLRNIEAGYRFNRHKAEFGLNLYLMDYKDQLILTGEINDVGGFTRKNIDRSYRLGLELEAGYQFSKMLGWRGNLSLSRNKIKHFIEYSDVYDADWNWVGTDVREYSNTDIAFSPSVIAASTLNIQPVEKLNLSLESKYVGQQYIDNTMNKDRMLDSYFVNNVRINYGLSTSFISNMEFVVQINNVLDVHYETNAWVYKGVYADEGLVTLDDGYFPQAGRHLMVGLRLRF
ncbi:MAG: TonB-dependent receptor [Bacteroidales bacterium]|nr:TonB-dependent receptor [Bacteroidales bacterium]